VVFDARGDNMLSRFCFGRLGLQLKSLGSWYFALCGIWNQCSEEHGCSSEELFWNKNGQKKVHLMKWSFFECDKLMALPKQVL